jgi:rubrerythrin
MTAEEQDRPLEGGTGYRRLTGSKTIGEILQTAMAFEQTAFEFYRDLEARVSKPLRGLVHELMEEEQRHYTLFDELRGRPDVAEHIAAQIRTPKNDHRFADFVQAPNLSRFPDDQSVLQYAVAREHAAMEQYAALADSTPSGPIQDLFQFLSQEELQHKGELEKRYYELVYLGRP